MPKVVIFRYSGVFRQGPFNVNGDGDHLQISVKNIGEEGEEVVFTGSKFLSKEYEKRGGKEEEVQFFRGFRKQQAEDVGHKTFRLMAFFFFKNFNF